VRNFFNCGLSAAFFLSGAPNTAKFLGFIASNSFALLGSKSHPGLSSLESTLKKRTKKRTLSPFRINTYRNARKC